MMSYQSGDKCLSVLGFTKLRNVPRHLFSGRGVLYITAQKGDNVSMVTSSLNIFVCQSGFKVKVKLSLSLRVIPCQSTNGCCISVTEYNNTCWS